MASKRFRVLIGLDHPKGRNEPGEEYTGPMKSVDWLLAQGAIEPWTAAESGSDAEAA